MEYRKFGRTDLQVSEIGFGAWAIGGAATVSDTAIGWGDANDATSSGAIAAAIHAGIVFDTADFYGLGHSETLLGEALKAEKNVLVATKVGHRAIENKILLDYSKAYIIQACEESLKRLQRDTIDYYQLHSARLQHLQNGECIEAMEQLKKDGKIRYWGLSLNTFHPAPDADFLIDKKLGDGFQLVFNLINQRALPVMETAAAAGYGVIARMPLQFGLLTGKFSTQTKFDKGDHRSFRLTPEIVDQTNALLNNEVLPLANAEGMTATQLALSYPLSFESVSTVIPGIRTAEQVAQNTTGIRPLSSEQKTHLVGLQHSFEPIVQAMEKLG